MPVLQFNVLWLNPNNRDTFPPGLLEALALHGNILVTPERQGDSVQSRLRKQMQIDALQPINDDADLDDGRAEVMKSSLAAEDQYPPELLEEATQFLRLQVRRSSYIPQIKRSLTSPSLRHKIGCISCSRICATSTPIVSGAVSRTRALKKCKSSVQAPRKMTTTNLSECAALRSHLAMAAEASGNMSRNIMEDGYGCVVSDATGFVFPAL